MGNLFSIMSIQNQIIHILHIKVKEKKKTPQTFPQPQNISSNISSNARMTAVLLMYKILVGLAMTMMNSYWLAIVISIFNTTYNKELPPNRTTIRVYHQILLD